MSRKLLYALLCLFLYPFMTDAQVTTGTVTGIVKTTDKQGLEGATITLFHNPSGTQYVTLSRKEGSFTLIGLRVGGPYTLTVTYTGLKKQTRENITVSLGDPYDINVIMDETNTPELEGVVVRSAKRTAAVEKSGASTVIDSRQLATLPSYSRSITDLTSLTPQSNGGNSFAGRSGYFNNLKVDGANLNNNFGLNTDPLPGGAQPISLDAFDQISVNIAPVDVRQSGFTGAGINAVTKSGTNEFHGTAFGFYRDQSFNGRRAGSVNLDRATSSSKRNIGASLGGPIIKNKLFFFVNAEYEGFSGSRITNFVATGSQNSGNVSAVNIDSLAKLSKYLMETDSLKYNTGAYDNYPSAAKSNFKYLAKIDWNINEHHKLTARYSNFESDEDPSSINATSIIGGGGFSLAGISGTISSLPNGRLSNRAMTFANSVYGFKHIVRSGTLELNSNYRNMSNTFLFTLSRIRDTRVTNSADFPFVDIFDGSSTANNYLSFGYEPYSYNNDVINNVWNITNNFNYYAGKHTFTGGVSYEYQLVGNMFMPGAQSYYAYNSLNDFVTNQAPVYYSYAYSMVPGKKAVYSAELKFGQLGFYAQDEIKVSPKLKVTIGVRADKPVYIENALENPAVTALTLPDKDGNLVHYNGQWPTSRFSLSPRVGMRYDVKGDKSLILRGSMGIFNGLNPFVWLTNMPTNSGMYQNSVVLRNTVDGEAQILANKIRFNKNIDAYADLFPPVAGATIPSNVVLVAPDFKFPQIFRTDLAVDKNLGNGFGLSVEGIITKDINAIYMRNANLKPSTGIANGPDNRQRYISTAASDRYIYPSVSSAVILENTSKGYSYAFTTQLSRTFNKGFYGSLAYTYTKSKDVSNNSGSQAYSIWNSNPTVGTSNDQELNPSSSAIKHRVVGIFSYRIEYADHAATTLSLVYQGAPAGNITYRLNGDMNGDGNNQDLMYVPNSVTELTFEQYSTTVNGITYTFTPQQQAAALDKFINNTPYLKNRRGHYTERNGARLPWFNNVSARVMQDFFIKSGTHKHTLQFTADILNLPNLLNRYWGINQTTTTTQPLVWRSYDANGAPVYRMQNLNGVLYTKPYQDVLSASSTWSMQLGVRYIF